MIFSLKLFFIFIVNYNYLYSNLFITNFITKWVLYAFISSSLYLKGKPIFRTILLYFLGYKIFCHLHKRAFYFRFLHIYYHKNMFRYKYKISLITLYFKSEINKFDLSSQSPKFCQTTCFELRATLSFILYGIAVTKSSID